MTKEFDMSDDTAQNQDRQPQQPVGNRLTLQGKALQVNENSVEDQECAPLPAPPRLQSADKSNPQKLEGKALQVNENSMEDQETTRPPVPKVRGS